MILYLVSLTLAFQLQITLYIAADVKVHLYTQRSPYTSSNKKEFDPAFGGHNDFLIVNRYMFAQVYKHCYFFIIICYRKLSMVLLNCMSVMIVKVSNKLTSHQLWPSNTIMLMI